MSLEITGTLNTVFAVQQITQKFKKREFILQVSGREPQYDDFIKFELHQDKTDLIDALQTGDRITVSFNVKGRKHTGANGINYFNSLTAWKIIKQ